MGNWKLGSGYRFGSSSLQAVPKVPRFSLFPLLHALTLLLNRPHHDPIQTQWSIMLSNFGGHISELRTALPIHILHHSLLSESRAASHLTRSLLFGTDFKPASVEALHMLPSYASHVHDRIANALDSTGEEGGVHLVPNPLRDLDLEGVDGDLVAGTYPSRTNDLGSRTNGGNETGSGAGASYFPTVFRTSAANSSHSCAPAHRNSPPLHWSVANPRTLEQLDEGLILSLGLDRSETVTEIPPDSRRSSPAIPRSSTAGSSLIHPEQAGGVEGHATISSESTTRSTIFLLFESVHVAGRKVE